MFSDACVGTYVDYSRILPKQPFPCSASFDNFFIRKCMRKKILFACLGLGFCQSDKKWRFNPHPQWRWYPPRWSGKRLLLWFQCRCSWRNPHQRKAKWIKTISRNNLSKDLRSSLKVHRTAADLSRHAEEIESLCNGQKPASVTNSIDVTYPLRTNFNISFKIPKDMSCDEAQRLSSYFASLYFKK